MAWADWRYRWAKLQGRAVADLSVSAVAPASVPAVTQATPSPVLVPADGQAPAELAGVAAAGPAGLPVRNWQPDERRRAPLPRYPWEQR